MHSMQPRQPTQTQTTIENAVRAIRDEFGDEPTIWTNDELIDVATYSAEEMAEWDGIEGFDAEFIGKYTVHFTRSEAR